MLPDEREDVYLNRLTWELERAASDGVSEHISVDDAENDADNSADEEVDELTALSKGIYPSFDLLMESLYQYALDHGFDLKKQKWKKNANGQNYRLEVRCAREGQQDRRSCNVTGVKTTKHLSKKCGCEWRVYVVAVEPTEPNGRYCIRPFTHSKNRKHCHPPSDAIALPKARGRSRNDEVLGHILRLREAGLKPSLIKEWLDGNTSSVHTLKDIRNILWRNRDIALRESSGPLPND
jgi:hypothetical protein